MTACKTVSPVPPGNPFSVLGAGASYYLVLPVDANRELLTVIAGKQKESESLLRALERTEMLYAGVYKNPALDGFSFRLLATGFFPVAAKPLLFPESKGWKKVRAKGIGTWYHSDLFDASLPKSGLVCIASGNVMEAILGNLKTPEEVQLDPAFVSWVSAEATGGKIGLYVSDASELVSLIMGPEIQLPVSRAEIYAESTKESGGAYLISARVVLADARSARSMYTLVRFALGLDARLDNENLYISGFPVTAEKLAETAQSLYFISKANKQ